MLRTSLLVATLSALPLYAQDGGQLYALYCSACHGADGKGATGGAFPPLAGSPWVEGDPVRAIKIVLHGLHGEVEVNGRTYNLEMPPQGAVLPDDQIAAILTHVRSSWGNQSPAVAADLVQTTRAAHTSRAGHWTAAELLKDHPLPKAPPPIANLLSQVYEGEWQSLPDFSKLKATNIEEEHDGKISLKKAGRTELFGMVWQGDLMVPENGEFSFRLDADDGARVLLDDREIVRVDGTGPMDGSRAKLEKVSLTAGSHRIRVEYFEYRGQEGIALAWRGPGIPAWKSLTDTPPKGGPEPIPIAPTADRAAIYRNFIAGTTPRAIGVGFPGGVNLAWSADHFAPELIWTGEFMDGSRHWIDRGQGDQAPAGENVVKLSGSAALPEGARFRGYQLDRAGNPTFAIQLGERVLLDSWSPADAPDVAANGRQPALRRKLSLKGKGPGLELLISDQGEAKVFDDQELSFQDRFFIRMEGDVNLTTRDGKTYLKLSPGQVTTLDYRWKR